MEKLKNPAVKEFNQRIVILGDYSVGKSSIVLKYVKNTFNDNEESTIGAAFLTKTILSKENYVKFDIWDTAGQERYNSLVPMYYRGAQAAIIVYDITSTKSYEKARFWVDELLREKPKDFLKVLIGNKKDLESRRDIKSSDASEYASSKNCLFYETSAKNGENIESIFNDIASILPREDLETEKNSIDSRRAKSNSGCC
jgi:Ras-related protein Rab-5C